MQRLCGFWRGSRARIGKARHTTTAAGPPLFESYGTSPRARELAALASPLPIEILEIQVPEQLYHYDYHEYIINSCNLFRVSNRVKDELRSAN